MQTEVNQEIETEQVVEQEKPDETLWEGGPTSAQVAEWKSQYGEVWITKINEDEQYVWRTLNRFEWKKLQKALESLAGGGGNNAEAQLSYEELVCEAVVLEPKLNKAELQTKKAGIASLIAQQVLDASGFVSMDVQRL